MNLKEGEKKTHRDVMVQLAEQRLPTRQTPGSNPAVSGSIFEINYFETNIDGYVMSEKITCESGVIDWLELSNNIEQGAVHRQKRYITSELRNFLISP